MASQSSALLRTTTRLWPGLTHSCSFSYPVPSTPRSLLWTEYDIADPQRSSYLQRGSKVRSTNSNRHHSSEEDTRSESIQSLSDAITLYFPSELSVPSAYLLYRRTYFLYRCLLREHSEAFLLALITLMTSWWTGPDAMLFFPSCTSLFSFF